MYVAHLWYTENSQVLLELKGSRSFQASGHGYVILYKFVADQATYKQLGMAMLVIAWFNSSKELVEGFEDFVLRTKQSADVKIELASMCGLML